MEVFPLWALPIKRTFFLAIILMTQRTEQKEESEVDEI
jgi:hypothetical protein